MEEISLAAKSYYSNSSKEIQQHAKDFFQSMDTDGDGRVSDWEFTQFLQRNGYHQVNPDKFTELDANCDGYLNFMEVWVSTTLLRLGEPGATGVEKTFMICILRALNASTTSTTAPLIFARLATLREGSLTTIINLLIALFCSAPREVFLMV